MQHLFDKYGFLGRGQTIKLLACRKNRPLSWPLPRRSSRVFGQILIRTCTAQKQSCHSCPRKQGWCLVEVPAGLLLIDTGLHQTNLPELHPPDQHDITG